MSTARSTSAGAFGESGGRPSAPPGLGRASVVAGLTLLALVAAGLAWSAVGGSATPASHPDLFGGSRLLEDTRQLTVVDLATGQASVQLSGINTEVDATTYAAVQAVPVSGGTYLVNRASGTFNLLGDDDYVLAPGRGVGLGHLEGSDAASGFADGADAYIVRYGPVSTVSLVDPATVSEAAARTGTTGSSTPTEVQPRGFAALGGSALDRPGASATEGGDLWTLVRRGPGCTLVQLRPVRGRGGLAETTRATGLDCTTTSLESAAGTMGVATPGGVRLFAAAGPARSVPLTGISAATDILPVSNAGATLWWVARTPAGWSVLGTTATGRLSQTRPLRGIGAGAVLSPPAWSAGSLYTLDTHAAGQPALWVVDPTDGAVGTVAGSRTYPAADSDERATFSAAEVLGVGPRIVFNNPDSLLAVVVFTDGSHGPVVVDKSTAIAVSANGPAQAAAAAKSGGRGGRHRATTPPATRQAAPTPAFSQQVDCQDTTEKPYQPTISAVAPSSEAALVSWSYPLLDPQDCEPDTWTVQVTALGGAPQPTRPTQAVDGQKQLELVGLRPTTSYAAVVSAHIGTQSTPSAAVDFETAQQGPDAPTSVRTAIDDAGDWVVSWTPCRSTTCLVPSDDWVVTATACGSAFVGQPPSGRVAGGVTTVRIPAGALLGASLSFDVHGVLADGLAGNPTSDGTCTQSWRPPHRSGISLAAAAVIAGPSVSATLQVSPAPGPAAAATYGSQATTFVYHVAGREIGPTTAADETVTGLDPNTAYPTSVTAYPTGHPSAAVTVTGPRLRDDLPWPTDITAAAAPRLAVNGDPDAGGGTLRFAGLATGGSYRVTGRMACGSVAAPPIDAAVTDSTADLPTVPLPTSGQRCRVTGLALHDTARPSPYGGVAHMVPPTGFSFPDAASYAYDVNVEQTCDQLGVLCDGDDVVGVTQVAETTQPGAGWTFTAYQAGAPAGACTATDTSATDPRAVVELHLTDCPLLKTLVPLHVSVTWTLYGLLHHGTISGSTGTGGTTTTTTTPTSSTTTTTPTSSTTTPTSSTTGSGPTTTGATSGPTTGSNNGSNNGRRPGTMAVPQNAPGATALAAASPALDAATVGDRSGSDSLEVLTVVVVSAAIGGGLRRRRARRPRCPKGDR